MKKVLVLASGDAEGGGSGGQELVEYSRIEPPGLDGIITAFISHHKNGGVHNRAQKLGIPFFHWDGPFTADGYKEVVKKYSHDLVALSGWIKKVKGLNPRTTINIHPGLLPGNGESGEFGGQGMWGHHVHEAVIRAYGEGKIEQTGVTKHFVTEGYDTGPIFWRMPVLIRPDDTPDSIGNRVNQVERAFQSHVTNLILHEKVRLEGDVGNWRVVAEESVREFPGLVVDKWV